MTVLSHEFLDQRVSILVETEAQRRCLACDRACPLTIRFYDYARAPE
jgi:hypothetical protein